MLRLLPKVGLMDQVELWLEQNISAGHVYRIQFDVTNGILSSTSMDYERTSNSILSNHKMDLQPVVAILSRKLATISNSSTAIDLYLSINNLGQLIDGEITIRSGRFN